MEEPDSYPHADAHAHAGPLAKLQDTEQDLEMQDAASPPAGADHEAQDDADGDANGDVLYYVDADGNPIDPSDMGEYALQLEEGHHEEGDQTGQQDLTFTGDISMQLDMDEHANGKDAESHGDSRRVEELSVNGQDQSTIMEEEQEEEEEQNNADAEAERYERPYVPPSGLLTPNGIDDADHQEAKTPDYAVKYAITGHRKNVSCIRFSPNGEWLITAGRSLICIFHKRSCCARYFSD